MKFSPLPARQAFQPAPFIGALAALTAAPAAIAQGCVPGNLVVSREQNPTNVFDPAVAAPIYLDQFTTTGSLINSLLLPTRMRPAQRASPAASTRNPRAT